MKKIFALVLAVAMLCVLFTGCMYDEVEASIRAAGSGTVQVTAGFSKELVDALKMQQELTEEGFTLFTKNGVEYYGVDASEEFASPEEFNEIFAGISDAAGEAETSADTGTVVLMRNSDGTLTLSVIVRSQTADTKEMAAALTEAAPTLEPSMITAMMQGMVMRYTFQFAGPVTQVSGGKKGVTISGNTVTVDLLQLSTGTYQFTTAPASGVHDTAHQRSQTVELDGRKVQLDTYALRFANGGETNYVKLRDLASILSATPARFNITWDGAINVANHVAYVPNGSEMKTPFSGDRTCVKTTPVTKVDGVLTALDAIVLTDDNGGAYTYYKLRDVGEVLGFNVGWTAARGIYIETDRPYVG